MPLFAAPGAAARRSVAQSQMRQAEHGLRYATDNARLELESAWTALEASAEVVTTQEKALELARESVSIAQVSYENGVITSAELNDVAGPAAADGMVPDAGEIRPHHRRRPRPKVAAGIP